MADKIQEITEKIYNEGVIKAKSDAEQIINEAKKEASEIIKKANNKEALIIEKAKSDASELKKNADTEMKLAARQFISNLKQQIAGIISTAQVETPVRETFSDSEFIKKIVLTIVEKWNPNDSGKMDLKILVPEKDEKDFTEIIKSRALETMNRGVEIQVDTKIKKGFKIGPKDGSYVVSFSDSDFENYFKNYFKEKTRKLLFDHDNHEE